MFEPKKQLIVYNYPLICYYPIMPKQEANPVNFKWLKLITPEKAQSLGISAESPVFVSPYVDQKIQCFHCLNNYTPLVYQHGYTTSAQHFCPTGGGLYHFTSPFLPDSYNEEVFKRMRLPNSSFYNWQAEVEVEFPIEDSTFTALAWNLPTYSISSKLTVRSINGYCSEFDNNARLHRVTQGLLQETNSYDHNERSTGILKPFCNNHRGNSQQFNPPGFKFSIHNDGSVGFSPT
jgi:hypothetical protein